MWNTYRIAALKYIILKHKSVCVVLDNQHIHCFFDRIKMTECSWVERSSQGSRYVFVTAFTFAAAFGLRDAFTLIFDQAAGISTLEKNYQRVLGFKFLFFVIVLVIALLLVIFWQGNDTCAVF